MVYIESWDEFVDRSLQLFRADPQSSRYVMKYRHCDGKLVLKVTDNREMTTHIDRFYDGAIDLKDMFFITSDVLDMKGHFDKLLVIMLLLSCLKFKTDQAQDAKKMEKLNNIFFTLMVRGPDADISEASSKEQMEQQASKKGRGRRQ
ncbi:hypothetical protein ZIOFF_045345 [Zingiber officinale]|uniref:SRP9 domain-containing protein n=1 Tax=Zingiber officinale TaxID=94328 RepID=A0A8J5FYX4_ZINOF|nr:hypothetical protein ZIOFF_045345 [Zingiber officinale]